MTPRARAAALVGLLALSVLVPSAVVPTGVDAQSADGDITIDHEGDNVTVENTTSQVIEGSADLSAGATVDVRVQSTGDTQPRFFMTETATVDENGTWAVAFDFSGTDAGGTFNVTVTAEESDATVNATGEIVPCESDCGDPEQPGTVAIDHDGDNVTVANGSTQVISGTANEPTGTEIVVTVQSSGDTEPRFFKTDTAVVTENGTWAVAFNFSRSDAGGTFEVEASTEDGARSDTAEGAIVRCGESCADTPPRDTPTPIPEQTTTETPVDESGDAPTVTLRESVVDTVRGDTAAIELRFDGTDTAVVVVGSEAAGYELETLVRDADGDGTATLYVDTELAGREGETVSASGGDEVTVRSESEVPAMLDAGEYDLRVLPDGQDREELTAVGTLVVSGASSTPTDSATPTETPVSDDDLTGLLVSGGLVLGGGAVALVLVRR